MIKIEKKNMDRLDFLNTLGKGDFMQITEHDFKSETTDAIVLTEGEFTELIKERVLEEIPYLWNDFLKGHLRKQYSSDLILNEYKELAKFDHTMVSNNLLDKDLFVHDVINNIEGMEVTELIYSGSALHMNGDEYCFLVDIED